MLCFKTSLALVMRLCGCAYCELVINVILKHIGSLVCLVVMSCNP